MMTHFGLNHLRSRCSKQFVDIDAVIYLVVNHGVDETGGFGWVDVYIDWNLYIHSAQPNVQCSGLVWQLIGVKIT